MSSFSKDPGVMAESQRLAAIDIGSNSIRLVVAEPLYGDQFRIIDEERFCTRLARSLGTTGSLDPEAIDQTIVALRHFRQLVDGLQVSRLETIATCAVREAANSQEFLDRVQQEVGLKVRVISAAKEGRYAFRSVQAAFDIADQNVAVVDIGGGSTEIVMASNEMIEKTYSTNLGAVRMMELYGGPRELFDHDHQHLLESVRLETKRQIQKRPFAPQVVYGTGGTFTTLASMLIARRKEDPSSVWGYRVTHADVRHLLDRIRRMNPKERRAVPGLGADRADIIVAGLAIVDRIMARLKANILRVHTGGVRDGLLLSMLNEEERRPADGARQQLAMERFAQNCGVDLNHSRHIAHLAGQLFDGLAPLLPLARHDRTLLEAAAYLQDVGYLINYRSHHKHSLQLILNSRLPGFRKHDLVLIANVARYHRGSNPSKKHSNFRHLSDSDQLRVRQMAAILRVAVGLDRGYAQRVESVSVSLQPNRVVLHLQSQEEPDLEMWAARERSALLEKVLGCGVCVTTSADASSLPPEESVSSSVSA